MLTTRKSPARALLEAFHVARRVLATRDIVPKVSGTVKGPAKRLGPLAPPSLPPVLENLIAKSGGMTAPRPQDATAAGGPDDDGADTFASSSSAPYGTYGGGGGGGGGHMNYGQPDDASNLSALSATDRSVDGSMRSSLNGSLALGSAASWATACSMQSAHSVASVAGVSIDASDALVDYLARGEPHLEVLLTTTTTTRSWTRRRGIAVTFGGMEDAISTRRAPPRGTTTTTRSWTRRRDSVAGVGRGGVTVRNVVAFVRSGKRKTPNPQ